MNKNILNLLLVSLFFIAFAACKKEENRVIYQGGTEPVLTASTTGPIVLLKDNKEAKAITLSWSNPNYMLNTGLSSQNVNYILQVDTTGKNFSSPKLQEMSIANDLGTTLTAQQLNSFLSKMEFAAGKVHTVDMRIKSTLANGTVPLFSNVITVRANPYLDFAVEPPGTEANNYNDGNLWVIGDCFGLPNWSNPLPSPQDENHKFTKEDNLHYRLDINFVSGGGYKMIQTQGVWGTQYHALDGSASAALSGSFEKRDADPQFPSPGPGRYRILVNFQTGKYTLTKL